MVKFFACEPALRESGWKTNDLYPVKGEAAFYNVFKIILSSLIVCTRQ
ncbi:MAG TPA: hypothetical protein VFW07_07800 [Parafilimonas sp.]|nr:hypothetical protein [Parafilimonas sp.]